MREVLSLTAPFFGLVLLGFLFGRVVRKPASGLEWLNIFIVYLALPALFFQILSRTPVEELSNVGFIAAVVAGTGGVLVAGFLIAIVRSGGDVERSTILALVGGYSNNGYLGPGLAITALGAPATVPVALIFAFENIMIFVLTPILMAVGGAGRPGPLAMAWHILTRIFTHPFIIAVMAGSAAAALRFEPPVVIDRLLTMLTSAAAPCALFAMGVTVALQPAPTRRALGDLSVFLTIKLIVHPLVAFTVVGLADVDPLWLTTAVLMAALPPATNVFVLATQYGRGVEAASNAVLVGTALAAFTVTGVLYVISSGGL